MPSGTRGRISDRFAGIRVAVRVHPLGTSGALCDIGMSRGGQMIRASRMTFNEHGEPKVTITLEGWSDVYRFADRMTELQVEFCAEGRKILRAVKRKLGTKRYHAYQEHLHGRIRHG